MARGMFLHERIALTALMKHLPETQAFDTCLVEPANADESILDISLPSDCMPGKKIRQLGYGQYEDGDERSVGCVMLLGDENNNPRQLDFYNLDDGISLVDLTHYALRCVGWDGRDELEE